METKTACKRLTIVPQAKNGGEEEPPQPQQKASKKQQGKKQQKGKGKNKKTEL